MVSNPILLDVGGTFIKRPDRQLYHIDSQGSRKSIAQSLASAIGPMEKLGGIGVAIPGPFDYQKGIFLMKHKFASVYGLAFRELVGIPEQVQLVFHHDVNALLLGAVKMLGLQDENTALVTLGTGLGFSYALKGQVQYAPSGSPARSLWNLPTEEGGILEDQVSARGICTAYARMTGDAGQSAFTVAQRAYKGDKVARKVYSHTGECLGKALREAVSDLDITTLLVGGQIGQSLSLMQPSLQRQLGGVRLLGVPFGAVFEGLSTLFKKNNPIL